MIKNKKIEIWKFEDTLPSSLYHLTSHIEEFFRQKHLPSSLLHLPSNL